MSHNHNYSQRLMQDDLHYHALYVEHTKLEDELHELKKSPASDMTEMRALKRKKLMVVDELERMRRQKSQH